MFRHRTQRRTRPRWRRTWCAGRTVYGPTVQPTGSSSLWKPLIPRRRTRPTSFLAHPLWTKFEVIFATNRMTGESFFLYTDPDFEFWFYKLNIKNTQMWLILTFEMRWYLFETKMKTFISSCRCVVLSEPLKDSSRSQESWNSLLLKLRTLLLMSFTKNLGRFEDDMRTLREKRTQPGWSFCEYFMVQVCRTRIGL